MRCADTSGRFASSGLSAKLYEEGCFAGTTSDFSVFAPSSQSERKWLSLEQIRESEIVESDNVKSKGKSGAVIVRQPRECIGSRRICLMFALSGSDNLPALLMFYLAKFPTIVSLCKRMKTISFSALA